MTHLTDSEVEECEHAEITREVYDGVANWNCEECGLAFFPDGHDASILKELLQLRKVREAARLYRAQEKAHEQDLLNDDDNQITSTLNLANAQIALDTALTEMEQE